VSVDQPASPPLVTCPVCEREVPDGEFCGACGAHLVGDHPRAAQRPHAYAANPHEHVLNLNAVSTLFPHLPHRRSTPFRLALAIVVVALLALGYARLSAPSIAVAVLAVPLLYLLYLYEVEVYEDEPAWVIGLTLVLGVVLGVVWANFTGGYVTHTSLLTSSLQGASTDRVVLAGVVIPLVAQALMLVGAVIIFSIRRFYDEALDGFTFAAAGAMGFVLGTTLVDLLPELHSGWISVAPPVTNAMRIAQRGLLIPFIYASTSGIIGSALWLRRGRCRPVPVIGWLSNLWVCILAAAIVQVGLGLLTLFVNGQARVTLIYLVVAALLLLWVRVVVHVCLLSEAVEVEIGPDVPCSHCYRIVPRMAFCPHCGVAMRSAPKVGVHRTGRPARVEGK
jgi:hypothetical protein